MDIRSEFRRFRLLPAVYDELDAFLEKRDACLSDNSSSTKAELCAAFDLVFTSVKHEMHSGRLSEGDFLYLRKILQEESAV